MIVDRALLRRVLMTRRCPQPHCGGFVEVTRGGLRRLHIRIVCVMCTWEDELRDGFDRMVQADLRDRRTAGYGDHREGPLRLFNGRVWRRMERETSEATT